MTDTPKNTSNPTSAKTATAPAAPAAPKVASPEGVVDTGSTRNPTGNRATLDDIAKSVADSRK